MLMKSKCTYFSNYWYSALTSTVKSVIQFHLLPLGRPTDVLIANVLLLFRKRLFDLHKRLLLGKVQEWAFTHV